MAISKITQVWQVFNTTRLSAKPTHPVFNGSSTRHPEMLGLEFPVEYSQALIGFCAYLKFVDEETEWKRLVTHSRASKLVTPSCNSNPFSWLQHSGSFSKASGSLPWLHVLNPPICPKDWWLDPIPRDSNLIAFDSHCDCTAVLLACSLGHQTKGSNTVEFDLPLPLSPLVEPGPFSFFMIFRNILYFVPWNFAH